MYDGIWPTKVHIIYVRDIRHRFGVGNVKLDGGKDKGKTLKLYRNVKS